MTESVNAVNTWIGLALNALQTKDHSRACQYAELVLKEDGNHPLGTLILGVAMSDMGRPEALGILQRAVELAPEDPMFRYNHAVVLAELGHEDRAMLEYRQCLRIQPDHADALWNYGEMLRLREHFSAALACFNRLPGNKTFRSRFHREAVCCRALGQDERAEALFEQALREEPDPLTHWEYAHFLLSRGRFAEGWRHYAHRFACGQKISVFCAPYPYPQWDGAGQEGAVLFIHGEQGYGDEIMFAGFIPKALAVAQAHRMKVILACRPSLTGLMRQSFPDITVLAHQVDRPVQIGPLLSAGAAIFQCPIGSLPLAVGGPEGEPAAYLQPSAEQAAEFGIKLRKLQPHAKLRVGLVWGANPNVKSQHGQQRNLQTRLLNNLGGLEGVQFVSLQNAERASELADAPDLDCVDLSHRITDFASTAAIIANLDLVISVCTSVAHLSGALGKPTWVMLQHRPEWRWGGVGTTRCGTRMSGFFASPSRATGTVCCAMCATPWRSGPIRSDRHGASRHTGRGNWSLARWRA